MGQPGRSALQVEQSSRLNWATQFLTVAYDGACSFNGVNFLRRLPLQGKLNLMTARVSMLLKSHASPDMLPFSLCNKKKTCNSAHEQTPLSKDTIDSVLRHWEVGRAKDLSVHPLMSGRKTKQVQAYVSVGCPFTYAIESEVECKYSL